MVPTTALGGFPNAFTPGILESHVLPTVEGEMMDGLLFHALNGIIAERYSPNLTKPTTGCQAVEMLDPRPNASNSYASPELVSRLQVRLYHPALNLTSS